ncbi:aldose epimerase family protein [Cupriavidus agavae]|uniref:Aldose 1-epimerase n=1 Tax=Cupriavidus agavae TaxID=1001822 RepID=A0A4Q7S4K6_9BURK|nr:aldose epimerase [Cupriavidus agavae]RZT41374.1 aldose 1-epimerase [Cupriavidus agavae]
MMTTTQRFQDQDLLRIGHEDNYLLVAPAFGGRLVRWVLDGRDILYWPETADWSRPAKVRGGNPLLFPFIGRHFVSGEPGKWRNSDGAVLDLPQHGFARDLPFVVSEVAEDRVRLSLASSDATRTGYPFDFVFTATYRLVPDGLEATLHTRNTGTAALPCYAGHHFYFALPHGDRPRSRLALPPASRVRQAADGTLTRAEPGEAEYALDDARLQDTFHVLHAPGTARLQTTARTIEIAMDGPATSAPWYAVTTWTERDDADFYCVEPWLGLPNAIDHGHGLRWIKPGDAETAVCTVTVR